MFQFIFSFIAIKMLFKRILNRLLVLKNVNKRDRTNNFKVMDIRQDCISQKDQEKQTKCVSFHVAMRWCKIIIFFNPSQNIVFFFYFSVLLLLCLLSIFPVSGIMNTNPHDLLYKKLSFRFLISFLLLIFATIETCCSIRWFLINNFGFSMAMSIVFFLSSTSFLYLFHYIAQKWHSYIIYWKTHEKVFLHYPYPTPAVNLARLLPGIGGAALFVAFGNFFIQILH